MSTEPTTNTLLDLKWGIAMGRKAYNEVHARPRLCERPGCIEQAVDRYRGQWICEGHLNPDLPVERVEDIVLVRSHGHEYDQVEPGVSLDTRGRAKRNR